jgi:hypothetical protein
MIFIINIRLGDLTMLHHIKKLFGIKPKVEVQAEVPYKVETPVTPVADDVTRAMLESIPAPTLAEKPAKVKKAPAAKKAQAPKKPRAPKKPKAV